MKKLFAITAVLICVSISILMTAYAQGEPDFDDPDWYKAYGFETDPRIDNPGWTLEEYLEAMVIQDELRQTGQSGNNQQNLSDEDLINAQREADYEARKEQILANNEPRFFDGELGRGAADDPHEYWETNGYPDYISFAYEAGGEVTIRWWGIGIVNADDSIKQEILNLLSPKCRVTFIDGTYSHSQREAIRNEILSMEDERILDVFLMRDETVWVIVSDDDVAHYTETFSAKFDGIIEVRGYESMPSEAMGGGNGSISIIQVEPISKNGISRNLIFPAILILLCGVAIAFYFTRARLIPAMQTNTGNVITGNTRISRKQTITLIKASALTPSDDVYNSLMERIDSLK